MARDVDTNQLFELVSRMEDIQEDYNRQLGIIGGHLAEGTASTLEQNKKSKKHSIVTLDDETIAKLQNVSVSEVHDDVHRSLIDRMSQSTFNVRLTNALSSVVVPLIQGIRLISLDSMIAADRRHTEQMIYMQNAIDAANNGNRGNHSILRNVFFTLRRFSNHPVWNSLILLEQWVVRPLVKTIFGLTFGFKKNVSELSLVRKSIEEQTQFLMTGGIDRRGSRDSYLFGIRGLVGLLGQGLDTVLSKVILDTWGVNQKRAQQNEERRARNEKTANNTVVDKFRAALSDFFYKDIIIRRGRVGGILNQPATESTKSNSAVDDEIPVREIILRELLSEQNTILEKYLKPISDDVKRINGYTGNIFDLDKSQYTRMDENQKRTWEKVDKNYFKMLEFRKHDENSAKKDLIIQKNQLKELKTTNKNLFWLKLSSFFNNITGMVRTLTGLLPKITAALGGLLAAMRLRIPKIPTGSLKGVGSKILDLGKSAGKNILNKGKDLLPKAAPTLLKRLSGAGVLYEAYNEASRVGRSMTSLPDFENSGVPKRGNITNDPNFGYKIVENTEQREMYKEDVQNKKIEEQIQIFSEMRDYLKQLLKKTTENNQASSYTPATGDRSTLLSLHGK